MSRLDPQTWGNAPQFDGKTFEPERDQSRLKAQLDAVRSIMFDGRPHTLAEIAERVGAPEASVSARLRDLRKPKFGGYQIERSHVSRGLWQYRLAFPQNVQRETSAVA